MDLSFKLLGWEQVHSNDQKFISKSFCRITKENRIGTLIEFFSMIGVTCFVAVRLFTAFTLEVFTYSIKIISYSCFTCLTRIHISDLLHHVFILDILHLQLFYLVLKCFNAIFKIWTNHRYALSFLYFLFLCALCHFLFYLFLHEIYNLFLIRFRFLFDFSLCWAFIFISCVVMLFFCNFFFSFLWKFLTKLFPLMSTFSIFVSRWNFPFFFTIHSERRAHSTNI